MGEVVLIKTSDDLFIERDPMHGWDCIKPKVKPRACRRSKSQDLVISDYRKSSADRDLGSQSKDKVISRIP